MIESLELYRKTFPTGLLGGHVSDLSDGFLNRFVCSGDVGEEGANYQAGKAAGDRASFGRPVSGRNAGPLGDSLDDLK